MCIYWEIHVFISFSMKSLVVYHDQGHDQGHDKQQSFSDKNIKCTNFVIPTNYFVFRFFFAEKKTPEGAPEA